MMKILMILFTFYAFSVQAVVNTQTDVKISIEDSVHGMSFNKHDYDLNDIVMCTNWSYVTDTHDATKIKRLTIMINPLAAGATFKNGLYVKNICSGDATIQYKKFEDSCASDPTRVTVSNGDKINISEAFTTNGFSNQCDKTWLVNTEGAEVALQIKHT